MNNDGLMLPPHSTEAEQAVIGGLLIDNGAIDRMGDLDPAAFFSLAHRLIFTAIRNQSAKGKSFDAITTAEVLQEVGKLDEVGGLQYIGTLASQVPSSANIKRYADIVRENCTRRQIMAAAAELMEMVATKGDISVAMDSAQSKLQVITEGVKTDEPRKISEIMQMHINTLEHRLEGGDRTITTGLADLDDILNGGFRRGQLVVLAARPSMGKTALSMHNALSAAQSDHGVLYLSMEMVASELADRAIATLGRVNLGSLLRADMKNHEWDGVSVAASKVQDMSLHVLDRSGLNFFQVATYARRHKRKEGLDLLVVDYLQLMSGADDEKRHAQIEEITRNLKSLAKELDIAIILLSQLSRKSEDARRPKLSHLRDSGAIEQDADVVLFIHREEVDNPETTWKNYADIHIAKQRQGRLGRIGVTYIGENVRFESFAGSLPDWDAKQQSQIRGHK